MSKVIELEKTDGRNIDQEIGTLSGEGSLQQASEDNPHEKSADRHVFHEVPSRNVATSDPTYYGRPVIKKPIWSWSIPAYYYVGGTAGGAVVLGAAATLAGRKYFPNLITRSRWIGATGSAISAVLLVYDLGKPSRFLYMLRVFRPTSPMNMGTWVLTGFSALTSLSAAATFAPQFPSFLADAADIGAGLFGLGLSGYTGVLVSNTVVPVWQRPHRIIPLLFLSSAGSSASSLLDLFQWNKREQRAINVFGTLAKATDLTLCQALEQQVETVPEAAKPLHNGAGGFLWQAAKLLTLASLALSVAPGKSRRKTRLIGMLGTAGAICLRFSVHRMGQQSAENPKATFHQQRAGQGAYEVTGRSAITGPHGRRAIS